METNERNELVDLYVDGECSQEERAAIEARAQTDERLRNEIAWALTLRRRMKAMGGAKVPAEFSERLQSALRESPAWDAIPRSNAPRVDASERAERRASRVPAIVGTAAAIAVVALCAVAFTRLRHAPVDVPLAGSDAPKQVEDVDSELAPEQGRVFLTPASQGVQAPNEAKALSEDQFWSTAVVPADELKKATRSFQAQCAKLGLDFAKFDDDVEFLVRKVGSDDWAKLSETLGEYDELRVSQALQDWSDSSDGATQDVRVSFKTSNE